VGTYTKTAHKAATITPGRPSPSLGSGTPEGWPPASAFGGAAATVLKNAAAGLVPGQPEPLEELLLADWPPVTGETAEPSPQPESPAPTAGEEADLTGLAFAAGAEADALTPVPDAPPEGAAAGVPVLAGGEDLADSTVTLMSYSAAGGPREVLLTTVTEGAEAKLMEALGVSDQTMIPVQVQQEITGRLPLDQHKQLHELVAKAAKSVNHKLKNGQAIPEQSIGYYQDAQNAIQAILDDPGASGDEKTMAGYYATQLDTVKDRIYGTPPPYAEGGKIPVTKPYLHAGMATVTKYVPAPAEDPGPGKLPAALRDASRIQASIGPVTGTTSWDGTARSTAHGKEYLVDLGGGWAAVYRPYAANNPATTEYSMRGQLEIHAPQGAGHGEEMIRRLGQLHLVNRPLTAAEGEWTYLRANITAQGLDKNQAVADAVTGARAMEELQLQEIFHERQHQLAGLDEPALQHLAREFQLEAPARCLPKKTALVRDAVAMATGYADAMALATSPGYDPVPKRSGGWLTWGRFDVVGNTAGLQKAWAGKSLCHKVTGANIAAILATGVLASTERRAVMGVASGVGMSESSDKESGGANSVFLRVGNHASHSSPVLIWDDPTVLMSRSDYYGYGSDHFGAVNPHGYTISGMTRDPFKIAKFNAGSNEVMLRNGIDLLGAEAPSRILCGSATARTKVLAQLKARGITHLGGKPVSEVVQ
jgi:hypothetical protein